MLAGLGDECIQVWRQEGGHERERGQGTQAREGRSQEPSCKSLDHFFTETLADHNPSPIASQLRQIAARLRSDENSFLDVDGRRPAL